jgi:hypothetical protein
MAPPRLAVITRSSFGGHIYSSPQDSVEDRARATTPTIRLGGLAVTRTNARVILHARGDDIFLASDVGIKGFGKNIDVWCNRANIGRSRRTSPILTDRFADADIGVRVATCLNTALSDHAKCAG